MSFKGIDRKIKIRLICFLSGAIAVLVLNAVFPVQAALVTAGQPMSATLWNDNVNRIRSLQTRFAAALDLYPGTLCGATSNSGSAPCVYQGVSYIPPACPPSGFSVWNGAYPNGSFITCVKN